MIGMQSLGIQSYLRRNLGSPGAYINSLLPHRTSEGILGSCREWSVWEGQSQFHRTSERRHKTESSPEQGQTTVTLLTEHRNVAPVGPEDGLNKVQPRPVVSGEEFFWHSMSLALPCFAWLERECARHTQSDDSAFYLEDFERFEQIGQP